MLFGMLFFEGKVENRNCDMKYQFNFIYFGTVDVLEHTQTYYYTIDYRLAYRLAFRELRIQTYSTSLI